MNKYTIAIPTHNNEKVIYECVKSAINAAGSNSEILISDTSSTEKTQMILKSFSDNRIKVFRNDEKWSMWENHNFLLKQSTGNYIIFLHSDDTLLKDAIKIIDEKLSVRGYPSRIILSGNSIYHSFKGVIEQLSLPTEEYISGSDAVKLFCRGLTPSGTVFSKDFSSTEGFIGNAMCMPYSDAWTGMYLALNGFKYLYINDIYFLRSANGTTLRKGSPNELHEVYKKLKSILGENKLKIVLQAAFDADAPFVVEHFLTDSKIRTNIKKEIIYRFIHNPLKFHSMLKLLSY